MSLTPIQQSQTITDTTTVKSATAVEETPVEVDLSTASTSLDTSDEQAQSSVYPNSAFSMHRPDNKYTNVQGTSYDRTFIDETLLEILGVIKDFGHVAANIARNGADGVTEHIQTEVQRMTTARLSFDAQKNLQASLQTKYPNYLFLTSPMGLTVTDPNGKTVLADSLTA